MATSTSDHRSATADVSYTDLYRRWELGNWSATEIDFTQDRIDWHEKLTEEQRRSALWFYNLFFHGEVILGRRVAPVKSGISMPGMWTPKDNGTLATAGLEPFFLVSPNGYNDSNLYLEMNFGGLYGHYLKDATNPGGTGWRWVFDDFLDQGGRTFDPGTCWLLFRFGDEGLWTREQPFRYNP